MAGRKGSRAGGNLVHFKASPELQEHIDNLAKAHGGNRSKAIKVALLKERTDENGEPTPIASDYECLLLLTEAARAGNVSAIKELRAYHANSHEESDALGGLDEIAERRAKRVGTP